MRDSNSGRKFKLCFLLIYVLIRSSFTAPLSMAGFGSWPARRLVALSEIDAWTRVTLVA
jgi:hypothetical protein